MSTNSVRRLLEILSSTLADSRLIEPALKALQDECSEHLNSPNGESSEFHACAFDALQRINGTQHHAVRVDCLLMICQAIYTRGDVIDGMLEAGQAALTLATLADDKPLIRQARTALGNVYADTGEIAKAIECYAISLEILEEYPHPLGESIVWTNTAVAFLYAAQYAHSIACSEHVIFISRDNPTLQSFPGNAYANISLCCLHMGEIELGVRAAQKSVDELVLNPPRHKLSYVLRECNYTKLLLEAGDIQGAVVHCENAKRNAATMKSMKADALVGIAEGLCQVHTGQIEAGIERLKTSREQSRHLWQEVREALAALVKAHEIAGRPQEALVYLREMIEYYRQTQQKNTLSHMRLQLPRTVYPGAELDPGNLDRHEVVLKNSVAEQEQLKSAIAFLENVAVTSDLLGNPSGEHPYRVATLAMLLAREHGFDEDTCCMIEIAARLHDVGKYGVPSAILLKQSALNSDEQAVVQSHPVIGADLIAKSRIEQSGLIEGAVRHHHEWWNGSGYPAGLVGEAIPIAARITALADVFDALISTRTYKSAWGVELALSEIDSRREVQFDPELTDCLIRVVRRGQEDRPDFLAFLGDAAKDSAFLQTRAKVWSVMQRRKNLFAAAIRPGNTIPSAA